ncbi:MAG TPA: YiiX/YebB-like N1pC/P60 family cysteine hydrolase [Gemmataceae bacterium]|nr:YiiX/YebB-like N1pC/P60 family cysteine hydrolase [Gemmataceae bacterium]
MAKPRHFAPAAVAALLLAGCHWLTTPSLCTLPPGQRHGNPWGPDANARREEQGRPYRRCTPEMACWAEFGRRHVADGDILFRRSKSCLVPVLDISRFLADLADSPFSHTGMAAWDGDRLFVYDVENGGVRKVPFEVWMLDVTDCVFAVKRVCEPYRCCVPQALAWCEAVYQARVPFDFAFDLGDDALYCSELVEKAYRAAGVPLSAPVPLRCLPKYPRYRYLRLPARVLAHIDVNEPAFIPGNACYGLYASPLLEPVYVTCAAASPKSSQNRPPRCQAPPAE